MLELVFLRHGEIEGAGKGVYYGFTDYPLSAAGRDQAVAAGERLVNLHFDAVYASTLSRAIETASLASYQMGFSKQMVLLKDLREMNFGRYEGYSYARLREEAPEVVETLSSENWMSYAFPDGESSINLHARVGAVIDKLIRKHEQGRVLIVTHGGCVRMALCKLLGLPVAFSWRFKADFGKITRIEIEGGFAVLRMLNG